MDLEDIMLSENKSDSKRQILYDFTYLWDIKKKNKHNKIETES